MAGTLTCDVDDTLVDARGTQIERTVAYVNAHRGPVVILTARREGRRAETERQLEGVRYDRLMMRQDRTPEVPYKIAAMKRLMQRAEVTVAVDNAPGVRAAFTKLGVRALSPSGLDRVREGEGLDSPMTGLSCASIPWTQPRMLSDPSITEASDGRPLLEQLPEVLANVVTMYHVAHGAHWNVKGQDFAQYHELFEEISGDVFGSVDPIAEMLLKLGHDAPFTMSDLVARRTVQDPADTPDTAEDLARMVMTVNTGVLESLTSACDQAGVEDQQGVMNLLAERIDMHQKWAWQLGASLNEAPEPTTEDMGEAVGGALSAAMRRRHATIVRTLPDGSKEYKFPIPDKAHARAALAYVRRSDLTATERARVIARAYKVLGTAVPDQMKESAEHMTSTTTSTTPDADVVYTTSTSATVIAEASTADEQEFVEATHPTADASLDTNEMVVTIIQPGANRSGSRFYPREAIAEAVTQGMFNGRKMFVNHASVTEMRDRPERSLTDWVSTIKETWIDPETGAAQARIKIVQNWFGDFLKQLQENDALPDIGLSIFAQGKVQRKKVDGRLTDVVERFTKALSVDWVTEPGAGGRVNTIWESYQPARLKEQEINVLNTMTVTEAVTTLREQRPDIIESIEGEQTPRLEELQARVEELETELAARDAAVAEAAQAAAKAEQDNLISEAVADAELPQAARERVAAAVQETFLTEDNKLDREAAEIRVKELIEAEKAYAEQLLAETRPAGGRGIAGLGDRQEPAPTAAVDKVEADIARRMGVKLAETEQA